MPELSGEVGVGEIRACGLLGETVGEGELSRGRGLELRPRSWGGSLESELEKGKRGQGLDGDVLQASDGGGIWVGGRHHGVTGQMGLRALEGPGTAGKGSECAGGGSQASVLVSATE